MHQAISSARNDRKKLKNTIFIFIFFPPSSPNFGRTTFVKQRNKKNGLMDQLPENSLRTYDVTLVTP